MPQLDSAQVRSRLGFAVASLVFASVLSWSYKSVESVVFAYVGLTYHPLPLTTIAMSYVLSLLPSLWLSPDADSPSSTALLVFYALVYVPFVHLSPYVLPWPSEQIALLNAFICGNCLLLSVVVGLPSREIVLPQVSPRTYRWSLILAVLCIAAAVAAVNGFQLNLSVSDVYVRRHEARDLLGARSIVGYAMGILATALMPLCLALGLYRRSATMLLAAIVAVLAVFSLTGQKSVILTPPLLIGTFVLARRVPRAFGSLVCLGLSAIVGVSALLYLRYHSIIASSVVTYRLLAAPAVNMSRYFAFFSDHPYYYFSAGPLRGLVESPYAKPMSLMLGDLFADTAGFNMNSNIWASAFGDAGYPGVLLTTVAVGLVLWLLDSWSRNGDRLVFVTVGSLIGFLLAEMSFPTALVTGGLITTVIGLSQLALRRPPRAGVASGE